MDGQASTETPCKEEDPTITTLLFDVDNTMYPRSCGLEQAMTKRILEYVMLKVDVRRAVEELENEEKDNPLGHSGIWREQVANGTNHGDNEKTSAKEELPPPSKEEVDKLLYTYYKKYGITLNGLIKHHNIDENDYLEFVHEPSLHIEKFLPQPSSAMRLLLDSIVQVDESLPPPSRWVFSNGYHAHVLRVLSYFNVTDSFDGIIDYATLRHNCKPFKKAFHILLSMLKSPAKPSECLFFDDTVNNLQPAKELGFHTVLVGVSEQDIPTISTKYPFVEYAVKDIYDIHSVLHHYNLKMKDGVTIPPPFLPLSS